MSGIVPITLFAVLLVAAVVGGILMFDGNDPEPVAGAAPATAGANPSEAAAAPSTSSATSNYECWDGTAAATLSECGEPSGGDGMAWVFPIMNDADCDRLNASAGRRQFFACHYSVDGVEVRLYFSQWTSFARGELEYDALSGTDQYTQAKGLVRWDEQARRRDVQFKAVLMYDQTGWAVTAYAPSAESRDAAVERIIDLGRPVQDLRGIRAG